MFRILFATAALVAVAAAAPVAAAPDTQALKQACHDDYKSLCSNVMPGGGRIIACLRSHMSKLTTACKTALEK